MTGAPADRHPQQGLAVRAGRRDPPRGRLPQRRDSKELVVLDTDNGVEFFYLRPRDIAVYVGTGTSTSASPAATCCSTPAPGRRGDAARLRRVHVPLRRPRRRRDDGRRHRGPADRHELPRPGPRPPRQGGVDADVVRLDGAVETAITLGVADVIADVVETGTTLRSRGWRSSATRSSAARPSSSAEGARSARTTGQASHRGSGSCTAGSPGVITARSYVMVDYDFPVELVEKACAVTPGLESPTVSPLADASGARSARWSRARGQPGDGRALRAGRAGHPRHRHRRLPDLSRP